jgi:hypothetical protein
MNTGKRVLTTKRPAPWIVSRPQSAVTQLMTDLDMWYAIGVEAINKTELLNLEVKGPRDRHDSSVTLPWLPGALTSFSLSCETPNLVDRRLAIDQALTSEHIASCTGRLVLRLAVTQALTNEHSASCSGRLVLRLAVTQALTNEHSAYCTGRLVLRLVGWGGFTGHSTHNNMIHTWHVQWRCFNCRGCLVLNGMWAWSWMLGGHKHAFELYR